MCVLVFNVPGHMETGLRLKVLSVILEKPGIEPAIPGLRGELFIHFITELLLTQHFIIIMLSVCVKIPSLL